MKHVLLALCVATLVVACAKNPGTLTNELAAASTAGAETPHGTELTPAADEFPSADESAHEARLRWLARPMSATTSPETARNE
jgi:hypothetical protein